MRKEGKKIRRIQPSAVEGYHRGTYGRKLVFVSDRPSEANEYYQLLSDGSLPSMFGIEVETQNWGIKSQNIYANVLREIAFKTFHKDLWKIESDISLSNGCDSYAECITQPMTKAYIRNHYRDFKTMFDWFKNLGISCDKTGDCGMHTHISVTNFGRSKSVQDEAIKKFIYIINRHYELMMVLLNRRTDRNGSTYYFSRIRMTKSEIKNADLEYFGNDHHVCVNMGHYRKGDIELRLVGGQKNFPCFRNTMESVFHLIEISKRISWNDCDNIAKVFEGCNNYVYDRLASNVRNANLISDYDLAMIAEKVEHKEFI